MSKPLKVAIYARVSTNDQDPDAQLLPLRDYAARRGFIVHKEYVDVVGGDCSQRKGNKDAAFQALMADAGRLPPSRPTALASGSRCSASSSVCAVSARRPCTSACASGR